MPVLLLEVMVMKMTWREAFLPVIGGRNGGKRLYREGQEKDKKIQKKAEGFPEHWSFGSSEIEVFKNNFYKGNINIFNKNNIVCGIQNIKLINIWKQCLHML